MRVSAFYRSVALPALLLFSLIALNCCATTNSYTSLEEAADAEPLSADELASLESRVYEVEDTFNVEARTDYRVYIEYGNALIREERFPDALDAYLKGLRLNAFDLDAQIRTAELEIALDRPAAALQRLEFVMQNSEDEAQKSYAGSLLEEHELKGRVTKPSIPDRSDLLLVIVPVGDVAPEFIDAARSRLAQEFRVSIEAYAPISIPSSIDVRNRVLFDANRLIEDIEENNPPDLMQRFYRDLGISTDGPTTADEKRRVLEYFVRRDEADGVAAWQRYLESAVDQYDAMDLLNYIDGHPRFPRSNPDFLGVLAITPVDIYQDDLNFLFALSREGASIMSTHRFFRPDRDTLSEGAHRVVVQAMTSFVQILSVERASSLPCATAYPHSLEEFDRKEDVLCPETAQRVIEYYELR